MVLASVPVIDFLVWAGGGVAVYCDLNFCFFLNIERDLTWVIKQ